MSVNRRVDLQDYSDQGLLDLFEQQRDRSALVQLYERYRVPIGNYLYRNIKNREAVADIFNSMMLDLVTSSQGQACGRSVSTKSISTKSISTTLFAMAHVRRREYALTAAQKVNGQDDAGNADKKAAATNTSEKTKLKKKLSSLPRLHRDVVELAYSHNFTFDEVAQIIGCTASAVSNCLLHIKNEHLPLLGDSSKSQALHKDHASLR